MISIYKYNWNVLLITYQHNISTLLILSSENYQAGEMAQSVSLAEFRIPASSIHLKVG